VKGTDTKESALTAPSGQSERQGLRVLHIGKFYPPHRGGIESHLESLCEGLIQAGVDARVVVANSESRGRREMVHGVNVERLATPFSVAGAPISPRMVQAIRREPADIVHLHLPNPMGALAYLASGHRGRLVVTYHSDVIRQKMLGGLFQPFLDAVLKRSARIICSSPDYIQHSPVLRRYEDRCEVIPLGIQTNPFESNNIERVRGLRATYGSPLILAVGRLVYYKGFEYLIQAMKSIESGQLLIIGEGPLRGRLERLIRELGLQKRVRLLGEVEDTVPYYQAADVFVLPSIARSEAFGIVQIEAMACGKPVVNTRLDSGVPYVSQDQVTGFTVPPEDSAALARALNDLLKDPELRQNFGRAARLRVADEFTREVMVRRTADLYQRVLEQGVETPQSTNILVGRAAAG
jgi:glycosyltransferase involved in cell wall biosynthesis